MANSYKNIIITTNRGSSNDDPKIVFSGANTSVNTDVTLKVYPDSNGTLSFEGSAGQLFSITNDLTGSIFSVNDVSGIPSIDVNANGNISLAPYNGKVGIGTLSPIANLHVIGSANITSNATFGNYVFVGTPAATSNGLVDIRATDRTPGPALYIKSTWDTINDALDKGLVIDSVGGAQPYLFTIRSGGSPVVRYHNYTGATEFWTSGSMRATTYKFNVDTDGYIDSPADGTITIGTNNFERMRIDSSGRVGIGTSSPAYKLDVAGTINALSTAGDANGLKVTATAGYDSWINLYRQGYVNWYLGTFNNSTRLDIRNDGLTAMSIAGSTGNVGIANTAPEARLHVYGANNASTALKVTTRGSDDGATRKGVEVVPSSGPNSTYYAFYADVTNHSANYGLFINNGRAYIKDLTDMLGNARITGVRDSNYGTLQIGDTTSGFSAGLGGRITFWGDTVGQGSARNAFAGIRGVKENSSYLNSLGTLVFETQTNTDGDGTTLTEKMRITSEGNVGIGTTSPTASSGTRFLEIAGPGGGVNDYGTLVLSNSSDSGTNLAGSLEFKASATTYAAIRTFISTGGGSGNGQLRFYTLKAGTLTNWASLDNSGQFVTNSLCVGGGSYGGEHDAIIIRESNTGAGANERIVFQDYSSNPLSAIKNIYPGGTNIGSLAFMTNAGSGLSEWMRITSGGNVGIGTTSPTTKLDLRFGTAGTTLRSQIYHTDNTDATSHSILQIMTGGASGGDPHIFFGVAGVGGSGWNIGLDNSDGDKFKISGPFGDVGGLGTSDRFVINSSGNVGIGTTTPTALLDANTDIIRIRTSKTPASATATGNQGDICWDSSYIYVCTATNTWVRANLSTW